MKRLLAFFLLLSLLAGLFCGCERRDDYNFDAAAPTQDDHGEILDFSYTEQDLERYYEKLEAYKELAINGDDVVLLEALDPEIEELSMFLMDQQAIASVLYYCDMSDEEASQRHLDMTDMITEVQEKTNEVLRAIYESDSKLKDYVFQDWTEEDLHDLMAYNKEVKEIEQRNAQIVVEFQALSDEEMEDIGPLYAEFVSNYNRMAQIYGYDNYYDYAYKRINMRDYSSQEVNQMRAYAQKYLVPALEAAVASFQERYSNLSTRECGSLEDFLYEDYDGVKYLDQYLTKLPEDVAEEMESVFDGNVVFPQSSKAMSGAFTTMIGYNPFCYFSRDYKNTSTVVHEMGHYYGGLYGDLYTIPLDLAEVQSQGNEWLMISAMEEQLKSKVYSCYLDYRMLDDMGTILISMIVDEFEQRVYKAEGVEHFTTADFEQIMDDVCQSYGGNDYLSYYLTDVQTYWRMVVLEHPVYYISYAVSLIPCIDLYFTACDDWDQALEIYLGLTRDLEEDTTFLDALQAAGLASPFDENVYMAIGGLYNVVFGEEPSELDLAA